VVAFELIFGLKQNKMGAVKFCAYRLSHFSYGSLKEESKNSKSEIIIRLRAFSC